jgi:mRNA interferase MazF
VKRGDLVSIAMQGAYGKPRPALVIQADLFSDHPSITILPVTGELRQTPLFRIDVSPTAENGLRHKSQVMIDKAQTVPIEKTGMVFGRLEDETMLAVNRALATWLGFA